MENGQGAVIERGRESHHTRDFENSFENKKFIVQTNHDVPKQDDQDESWAGNDILLNESTGMGTVTRRESTRLYLESIDEPFLQSELMNMLINLWPVSNNLTIFSSLLFPSKNEIELNVHAPTN